MNNETLLSSNPNGGKNNQLIRRAIQHMYPANFASALTLSVHFMADSLMAGFFFDPIHIAAIGIGAPIQMMFSAIAGVFGNGMMLKMASSIGRGDSEDSKRTYSLGLITQIILSTLFCILILVFAEPMVRLCGAREETIALASKYVRFYSPFIICSALARTADRLLCLYGYATDSFKLACIKMVGNIVFSLLLVKYTELGIAGLGLGSVLAESFSVIVSFLIIKKRKLGLIFNLYKYKLKELWNLIRLGLPSSCDRLIESFVTGIVNNILVATLGTISISIYAVTNGIVQLANISSMAASSTSTPLFGLLYGARDKNGMKRSLRDGYLLGVIITVVWGAVILLLLPLLLKFYGMNSPDMTVIIRPGVYIGIALIAVNTLNRMFTSFYEATDHFILALSFSIIADSILFPLLLPLMLRAWGYTGLWLGKGLCIILFFFIYYVIVCIIKRKPNPSIDSILQLSSDLSKHVPKLDISISADNANAQGISEDIHIFLNQYGTAKRTAYMASLCTEELAVDFIDHMHLDKKKQTEIMDIKLFVDEDAISIIIRNDAPPYNPLNFQMDDESFSKMGVVMAQKVARDISYNYMYRMNVVTIILNNIN